MRQNSSSTFTHITIS